MHKIIAIDFDGTLCVNGKPNELLFNFCINEQRKGSFLILWTCRQGQPLMEAVCFCEKHGLRFNAINKNSPQAMRKFGGNPRKIYADVYIDNKAVRP